jgi:hypothetical protein
MRSEPGAVATWFFEKIKDERLKEKILEYRFAFRPYNLAGLPIKSVFKL